LYGNERILFTLNLKPLQEQLIAVPVICLYTSSLYVETTQERARIEVLFHFLDENHRDFLQFKKLVSTSHGLMFCDGIAVHIEDYPHVFGIPFAPNIKG